MKTFDMLTGIVTVFMLAVGVYIFVDAVNNPVVHGEVYSSRCERLPESPKSAFSVYTYQHEGRTFLVFTGNGGFGHDVSVVEITEPVEPEAANDSPK